MKKRLIPLIIAVMLLSGLIYFSNPLEIVKTLSRINIVYFFVAVGLWFLTHIIKIERWRFLLKRNGVNIDFYSALRIFTAGGFISNITPAKLGEPVKSLILKKAKGVKVSSSIPSIFFERVFDIIVLVSMATVMSVWFLTTLLTDIQNWLLISIGVYVVFIVLAVLIAVSKKRTLSLLSNVQKIFSFIPKINKFSDRLFEFAENFHRSFSTYNSKGLYLKTFGYSVAIWIIEGFIFWIIFLSFNFNVDTWSLLKASLFIIPVSTLISVVTFLPGGIGSSEIITVLYFSSLFGLSFAEVTSVALVARVSTFWISTILGAFFFSKIRYKYKI